jgi:hypothetical protein
MKKIITAFLILLSLAGFTQTVVTSSNQVYAVTDINGKRLPATGPRIEGNPMLNSDWGTGMVKLKNGAWVNDVPLQFNLEKNELYFQRNNETYSFAEPVQEFVLAYQEEGEKYSKHFRAGYPAVSKHNEEAYYEVVSEGPKVHLLRKLTKIVEDRNEYGVGNGKTFKLTSQFYVYDVNRKAMQRIKRDVSSLKEALPDLKSQIEQLQQTQKAKSEEDFIRFIQSLNRS